MIKLEMHGITVEAETVAKAQRLIKRKMKERNEGEARAQALAYQTLGRVASMSAIAGRWKLYLIQEYEQDTMELGIRCLLNRLPPLWGSRDTRHEVNLHGRASKPWEGLCIEGIVAILSNGLGEVLAVRTLREHSEGFEANWVFFGSEGDKYIGQQWIPTDNVPVLEKHYQALHEARETWKSQAA